jgi:hypothetical protein
MNSKPESFELFRNYPDTPLQQNVATIMLSYAVEYNPHDRKDGIYQFYHDLQVGGCKSGLVSQLIYYSDTVAWYDTHRNEITKILYDLLNDSGLSPTEILTGWDDTDPLAHGAHNQNLLAWLSFEATAAYLMGD